MNDILKGALPIYLGLLAQKSGIKLEIGGERASTDGKVVRIPDLPLENQAAGVYAFGYLMHEDGHIQHTDMSVWPQDPLLARLVNALEDPRIETLQMARYPGARRRLSDLLSQVVADGRMSDPDEQDSPAVLLRKFILYKLRAEMPGQEFMAEAGAKAEERLSQVIPAGAVAKVGALMYRAFDAKDTQGVVDLAVRIRQVLEDASKDDPDPSQPDEGDEGGQDDSSGQDQGDPQMGSGQDDDGNAAGDQPDGQSGVELDADSPPGSDGSGQAAAKREALQRILEGSDDMGVEDLGDIAGEALNGLAAAHRHEVIAMPVIETLPKVPGNIQLLSETRGATNALRRQIEALLESQSMDSWSHRRSGRRLDVSRVHRLKYGDARVFERREEGVRQNTAVHLLMDRSISMRSRIELTTRATLAAALAMEGIDGVKSSVAAFPYKGNEVLLMSDFGEAMRSASGHFAGLGVDGGTPMAEAMLACGARLMARGEHRKILFLVTDGEPDNRDKAQEMYAALESLGIELIALGINVDCSWLFRTTRTIHSMEELPRAILGMLKGQLLQFAA